MTTAAKVGPIDVGQFVGMTAAMVLIVALFGLIVLTAVKLADRSLHSARERREYDCRGEPFGSQRTAHEAMLRRQATADCLIKEPRLFVCTEGHWHYRVVAQDGESARG